MDGFSIVVHCNNGEEHTSTDYFLVHPGSPDAVLASTDQDRTGPGPCWPELAAILPAPAGAAGLTDPHARLLLLLPALGDSAPPAEAVDAAVEALIAQSAPDQCQQLARRLLDGHPMWGARPWSFDADERSWICDGEHSPRQTPLGDHPSPRERATLAAEAVGAVGPYLSDDPAAYGPVLARAYGLAAAVLDADGQPEAAADFRSRALQAAGTAPVPRPGDGAADGSR
ncbi:hypothetical protein [Kitasatospora purpeofusca]|uniref:hypothetical protein n=1 Tax=Kitasatospora purpeofusca TaxID=67352 RepID=UPI0035DD8C09